MRSTPKKLSSESDVSLSPRTGANQAVKIELWLRTEVECRPVQNPSRASAEAHSEHLQEGILAPTGTSITGRRRSSCGFSKFTAILRALQS
jgi:hypothetical protein